MEMLEGSLHVSEEELSTKVSVGRQYLKIFVSLCQVMGSFNSVGYDIPWPASMDWVLNFSDFVNIPVFALPGLSCVYPNVDFFYVVRTLLNPSYQGLERRQQALQTD